MTTQFDLRTRPWVPVRLHTGEIRELSLHEVFRGAHEIRDIVGEVPTQTFALTRMLLAILHRSLDIASDPIAYWAELWNADQLPSSLIEGYLDEFADRFDLLHPTMPFFQVAGLQTKSNEVSSLSKLIADAPTGHQFFTTRSAQGLEAISFAEAARWVVHCQAFDTSGIKSGAVGDNRVKGGKGYPIGTAWSGFLGGLMIEGRSLKETLLLNLVLANQDHEYVSGDDDLPAWERPPMTAAVEERAGHGPRGQIELFTWQSRRIRLEHDGQSVTGVVVANGDVAPQQNQHTVEPMTAWRRSETQEKKAGMPPLVYMPRTHNPERAMWRGLAALLPSGPRADAIANGGASLPALVIDWIATLREKGILDADYVMRTRAIGIHYGSQSSTVGEIVDDALAIHVVLVSEQGARLAAAAVDAVSNTEAAVTAVAILAANLAVAAGGDAEGPRDRAREESYFRLDADFRRWISTLDTNSDTDAARAEWYSVARNTLWTVAQEMIGLAGPSAWVGRNNSLGRHVSTPEADAWFRRALSKALPQQQVDPRIMSSENETVRTAP